jgi:hypothetical protein
MAIQEHGPPRPGFSQRPVGVGVEPGLELARPRPRRHVVREPSRLPRYLGSRILVRAAFTRLDQDAQVEECVACREIR